MRAVVAIAINTLREAIRDRILYLFVGFSIVLLTATKLFGMLTVGDEGKVIKDLGLAGIQFFSMLIAVMMSVLLISREMESRTVFNIVSKPVRRYQFLVGKFLGLLATTAVNILLMSVFLVIVAVVYLHEIDLRLLLAGALTLLEMTVLVAFATLFAVITKPILGSVMTLAIFVIGHISEDLWLLTRRLPGRALKLMVAGVYYALPNLERFNIKTEVVHKLPIPAESVGWAVVYGLSYSALVLVLASLYFERKDLM
jgi:ABC-type transport system involved in multi-copper enzyme maturation permease subunit